MALSSFHLLAGIEATLFTAYSGRLDALAVDNAGGAGLWVFPKRTHALLRRSASFSPSQVPSMRQRRK
jgi:hypothetical protein